MGRLNGYLKTLIRFFKVIHPLNELENLKVSQTCFTKFAVMYNGNKLDHTVYKSEIWHIKTFHRPFFLYLWKKCHTKSWGRDIGIRQINFNSNFRDCFRMFKSKYLWFWSFQKGQLPSHIERRQGDIILSKV